MLSVKKRIKKLGRKIDKKLRKYKIYKKISKKVKNKIKNIFLKRYEHFIKTLPVSKDIIILESNMGKNYTGNPKFICEKLVERGLHEKYEIYYVLNKITKSDIPKGIGRLKRNRLLYFKKMATAKIWISDSRMSKFLKKRPEQHYIQTWHGTPLKKLAMDMDDVFMANNQTIEEYKQEFYENTRDWDYLIAQNQYSSDIFRRCFSFDKTMLNIGYPRNDILVNKKDDIEYINMLKEQFKIPLDKKVILYAPTWRDNEFYGRGRYKFNPALDFDMMQDMLQDEYVMIVKYHYLIMENINWKPYKGFIYNLDVKYDIALLYLISDILITDYSSVMFDYSVLKRPMLFFTYDYHNYANSLRGFYFDFLENAPGPLSTKTEELIFDILHYDYQKYKDKYDAFIKKFNDFDDGNSADEVVDLIEDIINKEDLPSNEKVDIY